MGLSLAAPDEAPLKPCHPPTSKPLRAYEPSYSPSFFMTSSGQPVHSGT